MLFLYTFYALLLSFIYSFNIFVPNIIIMVTGKFGLMVRVMGTSQEQPLTVQANFICKEIVKIKPGSWTSNSAATALQDEKELEFVQDMALQITDHPTQSDYIRFNEALDAWILEVDEQIKLSNS